MFEELREKGWNIKDINHGLVISETLFREEMDSLARTLSTPDCVRRSSGLQRCVHVQP